VLCTFAPRMLDTHPDAIKVPYAHSNVESDEVLYYVRGKFGSRRGVEESSFTLHPHGIPHGPHPGTIVASRDVKWTDELAVMVRDLGAVDWLLLPEIENGTFTLSDSEWRALDNWIVSHADAFNLRTTTNARPHLTGPFLLDSEPQDYAHISANGYLRRCSYETDGISLRDQPAMLTALRELRMRPNDQQQSGSHFMYPTSL